MIKKRGDKVKKILLVSSSGGHFEQLRMLSPLEQSNKVFWVTEKTKYKSKANYYLIQTGSRDKTFFLKMIINFIKSIFIWIKVRPSYIISTGASIVIPFIIIAKLFRKKIIYIETFARIHDGTRTGKFAYKYADLFIVQWKELLKIYPNAIYGGSIY